MDIQLKKKRLPNAKKAATVAIATIGIVGIAVWIWNSNKKTTTRIDRNAVTIATVEAGKFNDYIRIIGIVQPSNSIQISAEEGGIVEQKFLEEGATVHAGDPILQLRNSTLDLEIMNAEAELAEKQNFLRNTQVTMEQDRLNNLTEKSQLDMDVRQKKRTYLQYKRLYGEELVSKEEYLKAGEDYELAVEKSRLVTERLRQDSIYRSLQMSQLENDLENMRRSLSLIRDRRSKLTICAPADGELGFLDVEQGQSIATGKMIGRINVMTGHKIEANIDEHYIDRVVAGLSGEFQRQDSTYMLRVRKVYPDVRESKFQTDFDFVGAKPDNIRNGQSYYINLELGESTKSILLPRGAFFTSTGGTWIFVVDPDGKNATRRPIRIGRQNPQYYEVIEGLQAGEKVVISGYEQFGNADKLILK